MQDFYNATRKEITMVRGDTLSFLFQVQGLDGTEPTGIFFTCREKPANEDFYFQRTLGEGITQVGYDEETDTVTYCVRVRPDQTENLVAGRYYYDLELDANDDVLTLMKGRLNIEWDVTRR